LRLKVVSEGTGATSVVNEFSLSSNSFRVRHAPREAERVTILLSVRRFRERSKIMSEPGWEERVREGARNERSEHGNGRGEQSNGRGEQS